MRKECARRGVRRRQDLQGDEAGELLGHGHGQLGQIGQAQVPKMPEILADAHADRAECNLGPSLARLEIGALELIQVLDKHSKFTATVF